jgi:putative ABC transport system substrate-binding protein
MLKRPGFLVTLALGALAASLAVEAQPAGKVYRIGFLGAASPSQYAGQMAGLRLGLRDLGYVEGKNIRIEYRWAEGSYERLPELAAELVRLNVDVIITHGTPGSLAAKRATTTIPIVMAVVGNPIETGIVASLARPGGNITGSSFFYLELNAKRLEVLKAAVPGLARVAVLLNPNNPANVSVLGAMEERAQAIKLKLRPVEARRPDEIDSAFVLAKAQTQAVAILEDALFVANAQRIADLAMSNRLPSIGFKEYGEAGGLIAYAVDFPDIWRRSMSLVDKILKGTKPQNLPIQQATRFELIVNLRTAKALGLTIPQSFLLRVDHVIE